MFISWISVGWQLATKCIVSDNEPCVARLILTDLNPEELHHYLFMISLNRCNEKCNTLYSPSNDYVFRKNRWCKFHNI